jgi:hypothetical protein
MAEQHYDGPAIQVNPASGFAVEMRKWEAGYTMYGPPGRPYAYAEYPRAMFLAGHPEGRLGKIVILDTRTVFSDHERTALEHDGWDADQAVAVTKQAARDRAMAAAAAEANFADRRMSEAAQAERAAVEDATASHVAEIPSAHPKSGRRISG